MEEIAADILRRAARGDETAFRRLYEHYAPMVWRQAIRTTHGDEALATQLTQDTFVRVHAGLRRFDHRSAFSIWLFRIVYNRAMTLLSRRQRQWRRMMPLRDTLPAHSDTGRLEAREIVQRLLARLSPEERFLLVAREQFGKLLDRHWLHKHHKRSEKTAKARSGGGNDTEAADKAP